MALNQQKIRTILGSNMDIDKWYKVKDLIELISFVHKDFEAIDREPLPSEPHRPRWHRLVTNSVRMSPGRPDYPSDNSWIELRTRRKGRNFEYAISIVDPVEKAILSSITEDDGSGFIYAIVNKAFPNWVKIGKTIDFQQRLAGYQTYSPHKDFTEFSKVKVTDRHTAEGVAHRLAADQSQVETENTGEWFYLPEKREVEAILWEVQSNFSTN